MEENYYLQNIQEKAASGFGWQKFGLTENYLETSESDLCEVNYTKQFEELFEMKKGNWKQGYQDSVMKSEIP